jgi:ArsR family transcriptional regulator, arsenate/arsenite/antimonite-responsive transcriptional repressor
MKVGMASGISRERETAVRLCHALSDETRVRIIERLRSGEQCVCDLTDAFQASQSRLSFHLRVLKDAGLVVDRPEGRWMYYSLNPSGIAELEDLVVWLKASRSTGAVKRQCER